MEEILAALSERREISTVGDRLSSSEFAWHLADRDCPQLLERFGEIAFKVLAKMLAFAISNCVSTKFNNLKIR
jgi:hypothetical protein